MNLRLRPTRSPVCGEANEEVYTCQHATRIGISRYVACIFRLDFRGLL